MTAVMIYGGSGLISSPTLMVWRRGGMMETVMEVAAVGLTVKDLMDVAVVVLRVVATLATRVYLRGELYLVSSESNDGCLTGSLAYRIFLGVQVPKCCAPQERVCILLKDFVKMGHLVSLSMEMRGLMLKWVGAVQLLQLGRLPLERLMGLQIWFVLKPFRMVTDICSHG